jgi:secreted PhoX family phosphatase
VIDHPTDLAALPGQVGDGDAPTARPRSATIVITKNDGGRIGS